MTARAPWTYLPVILLLITYATWFGSATARQEVDLEGDVLPAVVQIAVRIVETDGDRTEEQLVPRGSGTVITPHGLILTSAHVLDVSDLLASAEARQADYERQGLDRTVRVIENRYVLLFSERDEPPRPRFTAEVVAQEHVNSQLDLAVLTITGGSRGQPVDPDTLGLSFIALGDSDRVRFQHRIFVVGYPRLASTAIVDDGTVNGFEPESGVEGRAWILTDATVSGGSSGGAAIDAAGRLIGVITLATELDCRRDDTNGDGVVDESDVGCVPVGSALARLRPINLARPLLAAAGLTPTPVAPAATPPPSTPPPPTETPISPTQTPVPLTSTPTLPPTAPVVPTATLEPTATATPTLVPIPVGSRNVPMFRADPSRTGVMAGPGPTSNPKVLWQFATGKAVISSPVVVDGVVYFGSQDGYVYALEASSGEERWRFRTNGDVTGSAAVADGVVYIGSRDSNLYALTAATGEEQWRFKTDNAVYSSPVVVASVVYFGSRDGNVYALDVASGAERWRFGTGDEVTSPPAIVGHVLYVGSNVNPSPDQELGGAVFALDAATGEQRWRVDVGRDVISSPAVIRNVVYVGSRDGNVYALDADTGEERWRFTTGNAVWSSPAVAEGAIYIGSDDGNVYALDAESGAERWHFRTGDDVFSSPAVVGHLLYVGGVNGNVYALDTATGEERWRVRIGSSVNSSPTLVGGVLYIGSDDGYVYAIADSNEG